ncbi:uncharacterized protein AMSG_01915 [Thecamonas trahens ATCC 50062]|uniref:Uncharacterized protein n=1 Tax=Thecamonas trahens ATCC 50062 TaxID=461836 RepID=A0A0L0DUC3_THETB|nr:hypothetical protein AMSG_01915 [Thecamonas trahens ATCC 50062]KNC55646.1 hypothetical protein AMSG_01915 [Thecamonas trahens ATCC 50062]|eukprot:XP_013761416.1 hypothetical protein AMSG_01915 [Thecamonas trahens ATCC 50062]
MAAAAAAAAATPPPETLVTFHVVVDTTVLRPTDIVTLRGSIPELGEWQHGLPMIQSESDPSVWDLQVLLPYKIGHKKFRGVFQYKYAIESTSTNSVDMEGGANRAPDTIRNHWFDAFRRDYRNRRFAAYKRISGEVVTFMTLDLDAFFNGGLEVADLLERVFDLKLSFRSSRAQAEGVINKALARLQEAGGETGVETGLSLVLAAIVGSYGLSSRDPWRTAGAGASGITYQAVNGRAVPVPAARAARKRRVPDPSPWCWHMLNGVDIAAAAGFDLAHFGRHGRWAVVGVAEAAERAAGVGSYDWLKATPLFDKHSVHPTIRIKNASKSMPDFLDAAATVRGLAASALGDLQAMLTAGTVFEGEPPLAALAAAWHRGLVAHAPSVAALDALFDDDFAAFAPALVAAFATKVQQLYWAKEADIGVLAGLVARVPSLASPAVAAAMLNNAEADAFQGAVLDFVALCLADYQPPPPVSPDAPQAERDAAAPGLELVAALNAAAKDWFRRSHAQSDTDSDDDSDDDDRPLTGSTWGFQYAFSSRARRKKKPTPQQIAAARLAATRDGLDAANALLAIPYFGIHRVQATLFELGRCHFFRGEPAAVLPALCAIAFDAYSPPLAAWLLDHASNVVTSAATSRPLDELMAIVGLIRDNLSPSSLLAHALLHSLLVAIASASPSLVAVLNFAPLWLEVFRWIRHPPPDSHLAALLDAAASTVHTTAASLVSGAISLATLRVAIEAHTAFLDMCAVLDAGAGAISADTLSDAAAPLAHFEAALEQLQCFISFYCNSAGVRIDASQLRAQTDSLRDRFDSLTLAYIRDRPLSDLPCMPHQTGASLSASLRAAALAASSSFDHGVSSFSSDDEAGDVDNETSAAAAAAALDDDVELTEIVLSQDDVLAELIPAAQSAWAELAASVATASISVTRLGETFGTLPPAADAPAYRRELDLLAASTSANSTAASSAQAGSWADAVYPMLADYSLLLRLTTWIPATLQVCRLVAPLVATEYEADPLVVQLTSHLVAIRSRWSSQTLGSLPALVAHVRDLFAPYSSNQLTFLGVLADAAPLAEWLLDHADTDEFNRLLQVCRPCTDDARVLSSIASLVHIRTKLIPLLYRQTTYASADAFLAKFRALEISRDDHEHLLNIQASFDGLMNVFEKRTRSPGIKSIYSLRDMLTRGTFVFTAAAAEDDVLTLVLASDDDDPTSEPESHPLEFLIDLRSKLMMTEIPDDSELRAAMDVEAVVEAYVLQLETLLEIRAALITLSSSGHFAFQGGYELRLPFNVETGSAKLDALRASLDQHIAEWKVTIQVLNELLSAQHAPEPAAASVEATAAPALPPPSSLSTSDKSQTLLPSGEWPCPMCTFHNAPTASTCSICSGPAPPGCGPQDGAAALAAAAFGTTSARAAADDDDELLLLASCSAASPLDAFTSMMHLVASSVDASAVAAAYASWTPAMVDATPADKLSALGAILTDIFGSASVSFRTIPPPDATVEHRADMLVKAAESRTLPVWVATADSPSRVIDVVLSVYARRGRLPEPDEIIFCTSTTRLEDVTLLLRRFVAAAAHGRASALYTLADIHALSYTLQCAIVDALHSLLAEYGTDNAASLLFVSGAPRQVILTSLSSQLVALQPLDEVELRRVCADALAAPGSHTHTLAVTSEINGGGKSHHILSLIAQAQKYDNPELRYRKLAFRESTSVATLLDTLTSLPDVVPYAFHLDIGHIIPPSANTLLFQLLLVGVLRDTSSCRVYHRRPGDAFYLEIPNSVGNKTALSLRFCSFLPSVHLKVRSVDLRSPIFVNNAATRIACPVNDELVFVCKMLRSYLAGKFEPGDGFDPEYNPWLDPDPTPEEAFGLLVQFCITDQRPSFLIFANFVKFMYQQFLRLTNYAVFSSAVLQSTQGLERLKHVFMSLLIETSKDFSLRSVPQVEVIGYNVPTPVGGDAAVPGRIAFPDNDDAAPATSSSASPVGPPPANPTSPTAADAERAAARFSRMTSWETSDHPLVLFYQSAHSMEVSGLDILSLNPEFTHTFFEHALQQALSHNGLDFAKDWKKLTNEAAIELLRKVDGWAGATSEPINPSYVITVDNLLKMLSILLRLKYGLPVVISGETGCGKSSLIKQLCAILGYRLRILNIHGGMDAPAICSWMHDRLAEAADLVSPTDRIVVFFDEVNTCNCMGLFKELVCDHSMDGVTLPASIKIIAACNPYRLKTAADIDDAAAAGLVYEAPATEFGPNDDNIGTGIHDPLANLVYRVHPLPESMVDHVFDFGALSADTERLYIKAVLLRNIGVYVTPEMMQMVQEQENLNEEEAEALMRAQLGDGPAAEEQARYAFMAPKLTPFGEFVEVFAELICASQEFVRAVAGGERSTVSLRDVARCVKVYRWFGEHFSRSADGWDLEEFFSVQKPARKAIRKAVILSLAYCYHARLGRAHRREYRATVSDAWYSLQVAAHRRNRRNRGGGGFSLLDGWDFTAHWYARQQHAQAKWLKLDANAFATVLDETQRAFVSHMKLGDGIALNEALCENLFMILVSVLNSIPIFVVGKPGSSKSLAMELVQANLNGDASENAFLRSLPAVEVFSYQCSPLSTSDGIEAAFETARRYKREAPNTVVVVLLDEVGLAEQSPHLPLKVLHKVLDEGSAGEAVVGISNWALDPAKMNRAVHLYRPAPTVDDLSITAEGMVASANLKGYLGSLAEAYSTTYANQQLPDFWGLREFYSTVRHINRALNVDCTASSLDPALLAEAVLRNFGGRPAETKAVLATFFRTIGLPLERAPPLSVTQLVAQNLAQIEARHLMLLTKNNAALGLVFDSGLLTLDNTQVIFGSDFPLDQTDLQVCLNIQRVKNCMAEGVTVVLVHCESLYESLYDLLNQHYCEYGGQLFVRLAFGTHSRLCPIDPTFRIVVVVDKHEAYTRLAPPLLNRFEKQVMERGSMLSSSASRTVDRLTDFVTAFAGPSQADAQAAFCGYHPDLLSSLVLTSQLGRDDAGASGDAESSTAGGTESADGVALAKLMWIATPEATCRALESERAAALAASFGVSPAELYFGQQAHSDLVTFVSALPDASVTRSLVMTYAPISSTPVTLLGDAGWDVHHILLHELSSERDLLSEVRTFFETTCEEASSSARLPSAAAMSRVLLLQCDPLASSLRRIEHAKYICENALAKAADNSALLVLLVHLPRSGVGGGSGPAFAFDFDSRWHYAFIDALEPCSSSGLPDVTAMLGRSLSSLLPELDLKAVLSEHFRSALAKLVYPYERTNDDVRELISGILRSLEEPAFLEPVASIMAELVAAADVTLDVGAVASMDHELALAGTFRSALHSLITDRLAASFAHLLAHMDRNSTLALYDEPDLRALWLYLFAKSFSDMGATSTDQLVPQVGGTVTVSSDGASGARFASRFPFSFYLARIISASRAFADADALESQFALLDLEHGLSGELPRELFDRYVYDLAAMSLPGSDAYSVEEVADVLGQLASGRTTLGALHAGFWRAEKFVRAYLELVDAVPATKVGVFGALARTGGVLGPEVHLDVLVAALDALAPVNQAWCALDDYPDWAARFEKAQPAVDSVLAWADEEVKDAALPRHAARLAASARQWRKLAFYHTFVREVAMVLYIEPAMTLSVLEALEPVELATQSAYRVLVQLLSDLNRQISRRGQEIECAICLSIPSEPVRYCGRGSCNQLLCAGCVAQFRASPAYLEQGRACLWCRVPNAPEPVPAYEDAAAVAAAAAKEAALSMAASHLMEAFVFEHCLSPHGLASLDVPLLADFVALLAGNAPDFLLDDAAKYYIDVVPSASARVALLRQLMSLESETLAPAVADLLAAELAIGVELAGYVDVPLAVLWTTVREEALAAELAVSGVDGLVIPSDLEAGVASVLAAGGADSRDAVARVLDDIARVRVVLTAYANALCAEVDAKRRSGGRGASVLSLAQLGPMVARLLVGASGSGASVTRSMRMFVLKTMERARGVSFVRSALLQEPLVSSEWLSQWRQSGEPGLVRFLGSSKLPRNNPFVSLPLFGSSDAAVAGFLSSGSTTSLESWLASTEAAETSSGRVVAALLAAVFHQVYLLHVLPVADQGELASRKVALEAWLESSPGLQAVASSQERALVAFFARGGVTGDKNGAGASSSSPASAGGVAAAMLAVNPESSPEELLQARVVAHVAVAALAAHAHAPMALLKTMLLEPGAIAGSYLPTMPEDIRKMAQTALGGRWYACPNGHAYYTDKCGRPTQVLQCAECGEQIGGESHNLLETNIDLGDVGTELYQKTEFDDQTSPNYCIRAAADEADDRFFSVRALNPVATRVVRLLMHAALVLGGVAGWPSWRAAVRPLFNTTYCDPDDAVVFFEEHFFADWELLSTMLSRTDDDVAMLLHAGLTSMDVRGGGLAQDARVLASTDARGVWEEHLVASHLFPLFDTDGLAARLAAAYATASADGDTEGSLFTGELLESVAVDELAPETRALAASALFLYRAPFSLEHFVTQLNMDPLASERFPILTEYLAQAAQLRGCAHLPGTFAWLGLVLQRFNHRLDRETARATTVGEVLDALSETERPRWEAAFEEYVAAWTAAWKYVERFGCLRIPQLFVNVRMERSTPLAFSLCSDKDEGICPVALVRFLVEKHNTLVERVDEVLLLGGRELQRAGGSGNVVQGAFMTPAHVLACDRELDFAPYVEKQCVQYTQSGDIVYDFAAAQGHLVARFLGGKPLIDVELRMTRFVSEGGVASGMLAVRQKIVQEPLPRELAEAITRDLSSLAVAHRVLQTLETVAAFLSATGGSLVQRLDIGEHQLVDYLRTVLLNAAAESSLPVNIKQHVRLKHLEGLYRLLQEFTAGDAFDKVASKYKDELSTADRDTLCATAPKLDLAVLLPPFREFIASQLIEVHVDGSSSIRENLSWLILNDDSYLADAPWFAAFPDHVEMRCAVAVWELLATAHAEP